MRMNWNCIDISTHLNRKKRHHHCDLPSEILVDPTALYLLIGIPMSSCGHKWIVEFVWFILLKEREKRDTARMWWNQMRKLKGTKTWICQFQVEERKKWSCKFEITNKTIKEEKKMCFPKIKLFFSECSKKEKENSDHCIELLEK